MHRLNHWIRSTLGFSKSEANGMIILLPLVFIIVASPYIYKHWIYNPDVVEFDYEYMERTLSMLEENIANDSMIKAEEREKYYADMYKSKSKSYPSYQKLGSKKLENTHIKPTYVKKEIQPFDINLADTTELKKIKGIGSVLSARIIKYRDWLGGFTSKEQLKEVYGLKDSVLLSLDTLAFIAKEFKPKSLRINTLPSNDIKKHPYVSYNLANALDAYKFQHGTISSIDDLKQIKLFDSVVLQKLSPYLDFSTDKD